MTKEEPTPHKSKKLSGLQVRVAIAWQPTAERCPGTQCGASDIVWHQNTVSLHYRLLQPQHHSHVPAS